MRGLWPPSREAWEAYKAELEVAAAQSAVTILEGLGVRVKDRDGALQRARYAVAQAEQRRQRLLEAQNRAEQHRQQLEKRQQAAEFEAGPPPWSS